MKQNLSMNTLEPTFDEWKKLYEASIEFKKIKPWEWMQDNDLFAIKDPQTGEYAYCCIMGNLGEYYGIAAYLGPEGLDGILKVMNDEIEPDDPDFMFIQKCLMVSFEDRTFLAEEDRKIIKQLGLRFRGKNEWPIFRNHTPGYFPWFISADECRFLTIILNQSVYIALKCKEEGFGFFRNTKLAKDDNKLSFFTRIPERKNGGVKWNNDYINPLQYSAKYTTFKLLDELKTKRLQKLCKRKGAAWEVDTFYSPGPIQEDPHMRPYYPKVCLIFDQGRGTILGFNIIKNIEDEGNKFLDLISELIETYKQLPYKIIIQRDETYYLLLDYCKQLGINLEKVDYLVNLEEARYEMHNFFESMGDTGSEFDE